MPSFIRDLKFGKSPASVKKLHREFERCNKEEHQNAFNYYKQDLEQIENLYIDIKKKNKELENENTDLRQEIETMKQKKFMGLFKVFK